LRHAVLRYAMERSRRDCRCRLQSLPGVLVMPTVKEHPTMIRIRQTLVRYAALAGILVAVGGLSGLASAQPQDNGDRGDRGGPRQNAPLKQDDSRGDRADRGDRGG